MSVTNKNDKRWCLWLVLLASLLLIGCQSTETFYRGYLAGNESVAPLTPAGSPTGQWKTFDIDLNYQYGSSGNDLNISGTIDFGLFYELNTSRIETIDFYLFFLDSESRVLNTARLFRSLSLDPEETITFNTSVTPPSGAKSIAFGYSGRAREDGGGGKTSSGMGEGGGGTFLFYDLPKRPNG